MLFSTGLALAALVATIMLKPRAKIANCAVGSDRCIITLGRAGKVNLPAAVVFQTQHGTFLGAFPPSGILICSRQMCDDA